MNQENNHQTTFQDFNDLSINHLDSVEKLNNFIQKNGVSVVKTDLKKYNHREYLAYFNRVTLEGYQDENGFIDWLAPGIEFDLNLYVEGWGYSSDCDEKYELESLFYDDLNMWPIYFEPFIYHEKIAIVCHLLAFKFRGQKLLALGGCGQDLSPKLDAYQASTSGTIDRNSTFFTQKDYFKYIVGKDVTKQVEKAITLKNPIVEISLSEVA